MEVHWFWCPRKFDFSKSWPLFVGPIRGQSRIEYKSAEKEQSQKVDSHKPAQNS